MRRAIYGGITAAMFALMLVVIGTVNTSAPVEAGGICHYFPHAPQCQEEPPPVCDNGEHVGNPHCETPTPTVEPTPEPTAEPTPEPTVEPTPEPTVEPTPEPTVEPTSTAMPDEPRDSCFDHPTDPCTEPTPTPTATATPVVTPVATPEPTPPALGPAPVIPPVVATPKPPVVQLPPSGVIPGAPETGNAGLKVAESETVRLMPAPEWRVYCWWSTGSSGIRHYNCISWRSY